MDQFPWDDSETEMNDNEKTLVENLERTLKHTEGRLEAETDHRKSAVETSNRLLIRADKAEAAVAALRDELEDRGCRREGRGCGLDSPSKPCSTCSLLAQAEFGEGWVSPEVSSQAIEALEDTMRPGGVDRVLALLKKELGE